MRDGARILLVAAAAVLLLCAGALHPALLHMRSACRLDAAPPLENLPPLVAFTTIALGGFRGVIADALWLRASYLQEQQRFLELVQLSDWITKLQPRCGEIWAFHAWNMAYNVSVMMPDHADRWRWVQNGIRLLRDEGVAYNPGDPRLYSELGWLFQHKIGGDADRAHMLYKREWAAEMTKALGGARPDFAARFADRAYADRLRRDYGLLTDVMRRVDARYGPLDWRMAETHAIYWASRGLDCAGPEGCLPCSRMIAQCMATLFRRGRLDFTPQEGVLAFGPDIALLPRVRAAFETALAAHPQQAGLREAYANFLQDAVRLLYAAGEEQEARDLFRFLRQTYPSRHTVNDFETFVRQSRPPSS